MLLTINAFGQPFVWLFTLAPGTEFLAPDCPCGAIKEGMQMA
jgi:hypothetical protein